MALAAHTSDFIGLLDESGLALHLNRSVRGAEGEDVEGKPLEAFLSPSRAQQIREMIRLAAGSGEPIVNDALRVEALDGSARWFIEKCVPIRQPDGRWLFVLVRTETTPVRRAEAALEASEARYLALFRSNPVAVLVVDVASLAILAVNPAAVRLYALDEAALRTMAWLDLFPPATREAEARTFRENLRHERRRTSRQRRSDGARLTVEIVDYPVAFAGAMARQVVVHDTTERELLEEQLRHAQKMEAMGVFAGGVAHDFNNLLSVITTCTETAREDIDHAAEAYEDLGLVLDAAGRANHLTKKLTLFSKRMVTQPAPIDLVSIVDEHRSVLAKVFGARIRVEVEHAVPTLTIVGDRTEIGQVVSNLVFNAGQAIEGSGRVVVRTGSVFVDAVQAASHAGAEPGRYAEVSVTDNGAGMDESTLARVFEPFFTTKVTGTGLGLAVVHGVVERHHGFVIATSSEGKGTSIRALFPLSERRLSSSQRTKAVALGTERILLVDDEPTVRMLTERTLRRCGYRVVSAADGEEGVRAFIDHEGAFDLVVMDVVMPKLDGPAALRRMREVRPELKALFITGHAPDAPALMELLKSSRVRLVHKPFIATVLAEEVRALLDSDLAASPDESRPWQTRR